MDSARHKLHAVVEVTHGTTPNNPAWKTIRHTGTNLALAKETFKSEELHGDRQLRHFRHGSKQTGGDVNGELSFATYDDFLEAVLCGTWAVKAAPYTAGTISAAAADNSINDSANGLPVLTPGDKVTIAGFSGTVGNNQVGLTVVTSTAAKMVLSGGVALVNDAAGENVTVTTLTQKLKTGVVRRSFSILREFTDATAGQKGFHLYPGQEYGKLTLNVPAKGLIKIAFGVLGKTEAAPSDTAPAGSAYTAPNANPVMDALIGSVKEGGAAIATVTEIALTLDNGLEPKHVVGSADAPGRASISQSNLSGQVSAYFEDASLKEKFLNETESSLEFMTLDQLGNGYRFTLPRIKYNGGQPDTAGQGAIVGAYPIQALADTVHGVNLVVEKIPAS